MHFRFFLGGLMTLLAIFRERNALKKEEMKFSFVHLLNYFLQHFLLVVV